MSAETEYEYAKGVVVEPRPLDFPCTMSELEAFLCVCSVSPYCRIHADE